MNDDTKSALQSCVTVHGMVNVAKVELGITNPNALLCDDDIREICKLIATRAPDTTFDDEGTPTLGKIGIDMLLLVSMTAFPEFYSRYQLSQLQ